MVVNNSNFIVKEIPQFHPLSNDRKVWWKEQKRNVVEGYWSNGKWMPGVAYLYVNFWHIMLNLNKNSKNKTLSRPFLRDLEWEKSYIYTEARGFSGFSEDKDITCLEEVKHAKQIINLNGELLFGEELERVRETNADILLTGHEIKYMNPREYLRMNHGTSKGKPLYHNQAKNVIDIEARGTGKSYFAGCMIAHNFLTDGANDYDEYLRLKAMKTPMTSETLVGAIDAKYSKDTLNKFLLGMTNLPGGIKHGDKFYPSPLFLSYEGSLAPGKFIEAVYDKKVGGQWRKEGSRSKVHHRSFGDNPFAGNGLRPGFSLLDEIGFMGNLTESLGAMRDTTMDQGMKFGTIWMCGTGGDMSGGATMAAQEVFYNPDSYDCLVFNDEYENRGNIGFFIPSHMKLDRYRDENGTINKETAKAVVEKDREKAIKAGPAIFNDLIQNNPEKPSEAFLVIDGNFFPVSDLKDHLAEVETNKARFFDAHWKVRFKLQEDGDVKPENETTHAPITDFPLKEKGLKTGCIEIFEHPIDNAPLGRYIAGTDPYDDDESTTDSLGSTFILDTFTDRIVAEYTGRPATAKEYYETVRRLLKYYRATCNYENNKKGMFSYFDNQNCLYMLADTPSSLRDVDVQIEGLKGNKSKGTNATVQVNKWARELVKSWLLSQAYNRDEGVPNLKTLKSVPVIKELINWNKDGNFDRVSALGMLMIYREERVKQTESIKKDTKELAHDEFFTRRFKRKAMMNRLKS